MENLTIREVKRRLRDEYDNLETYLNEKKINFEKTQPKSPSLNKIIVDGSHPSFDKFSHYVIKDENIDLNIVSVLEKINNYENLIIKRIKSIALSNKDEAKVIILREDEKYAREHGGKPMSWELIGEATHYSSRQCQRIYDKYLNS